jgi:hypothetical protein
MPTVKTPKDLGRSTVIAFGAGCTYHCLETWLARANVMPSGRKSR